MDGNKKVKPRQQQAIDTKRKIETVALNLINRCGINDVTIRDICEEAGVSIGTFYHYYKTKSDIFNQIFKEGDDYFERVVKENIQGLSIVESIDIFFDEYADFITTRDFDNIRQLYFSQSSLFINKNRSMNTVLTAIFKKGIDDNQLEESYSSEQLSEYYFIAIRGVVYDWCLHDGEYNLKNKIRGLLKILYHSIPLK